MKGWRHYGLKNKGKRERKESGATFVYRISFFTLCYFLEF